MGASSNRIFREGLTAEDTTDRTPKEDKKASNAAI